MSESAILHNFPQWEKLVRDLGEDPDNSSSWEELISHHEKLVKDHASLLKTRRELKQLLYRDMNRILTKYPYCEAYWLRYNSMVDTLDGVNASIALMKRAVFVFPYSLSLWNKYISSLLTYQKIGDDEMESMFREAASKVGYFFLAHEFWDMYLKWAKSKYGDKSNDYIAILREVICIPLHQYAKYNEEFVSLCRNFTVADLIPKPELNKFIVKKNYITDITEDDLSQIDEYAESHTEEILTQYFNEILHEVQQRASDKWKYESDVKMEYDLEPVTNGELDKWIRYIDYEENYHKLKDDMTNNVEIITLYERALVPTCNRQELWMRYNRYLIQNGGDKRIITNFNKACDHFVPLELKDVRYMYIQFMHLKLNQDESCKSLFISMIEKLRTDDEVVAQYIRFLFKLCKDEDAKTALAADIVTCAHLFNKNEGAIAHVSKKAKPSAIALTSEASIKNEDILHLSKLLNFWLVGQLVVSACTYFWLELHNVSKTRDTLVAFMKTPAVKSSRTYWFFFFKFEKSQRNMKNLTHVIEMVKTWSTLSISDVNFLVEEYNSLAFKNFTVTDMKKSQRDIIKNILEIDPESSFHMKHFLKIRLAADNDEDSINKRIIRENGHPSATCESRPAVINPILITTNTWSIPTRAFPLPKFRNVEKANASVKHVNESI